MNKSMRLKVLVTPQQKPNFQLLFGTFHLPPKPCKLHQISQHIITIIIRFFYTFSNLKCQFSLENSILSM